MIGNNVETTAGPVSVDPQRGTFNGTLPASALNADGSLSGTFDANHAATETLQIDFVDPVDAGGVCSTGPISWTAHPTPAILLPGHYLGGTGIGETSFIAFDVQADGKTVSNLTVGASFACQPNGTLSGTLGPIATTAPVTGRTLVLSGGNANPTSGSPYTISLNLVFDAAGYFTGTTDIHSTVTQQGSQSDATPGS